ncbi:MAG TPA: hypothetical protein VJR89_18965 [Polyangiales bacterium]|nr:hypothetical protein [Polyangiales bacterium]
MSFDPNVLLASLAVSGVGFVLFTYGRKQQRFPHTAIGLAMLIYPYFVTSIAWMLGLVPALLALLWLLTRLGL